MRDIVERLQRWALIPEYGSGLVSSDIKPVCMEAADELTRLRALNEELLGALKLVTQLPVGTDFSDKHNATVRAAELIVARAKGGSNAR